MAQTAPVNLAIPCIPSASRRKKRNHRRPHESQQIANQTSQAVCAVAKPCRKTGLVVMATKRQNQPSPRPSALFQRFQATQKYVKAKRSVSAAPLMEAASAPGPNAQ